MWFVCQSSMLATWKVVSPHDYVRDTRYSHCCSPLCNNFTLLLSQAIWSLRLGSAIKETSKMNMTPLCPCARDSRKTRGPQRNVPLLSKLIMSHPGGRQWFGNGESSPARLEIRIHADTMQCDTLSDSTLEID